MGTGNLFTILFLAVLAFVVAAFLYSVLRHGGFKAAMFGARIDRTLGEVTGGGARLMNVGLRGRAEISPAGSAELCRIRGSRGPDQRTVSHSW